MSPKMTSRSGRLAGAFGAAVLVLVATAVVTNDRKTDASETMVSHSNLRQHVKPGGRESAGTLRPDCPSSCAHYGAACLLATSSVVQLRDLSGSCRSTTGIN